MEAVSQKANDFVEGGLIAASIFVHILEFSQFLGSGIVD